MLNSVAAGASHPPIIPSSVHTSRQTQSTGDPKGAAQYQFTTIDVPGTSDTEAYGINNTDLVSGFYVVNGTGHAFLWRNGILTTLPDKGSNTLLGEVNEPGFVVGNYGPFEAQHAAIYSIRANTWTTLPDVPNLPINLGNGINPQGTAVGSASMGSVAEPSGSIGWIWDGSNYSFFTVPGATGLGTEAVGINAPGQISGYFEDVNGSFHGFLKQGSRFTQIDVPGATDTFAYGINNPGDQVGYYVDQEGNVHGFVLRAGNFTTIDVPGSGGTIVTNINEPGDLTGLWFDQNGTHAFIARRH
jgi:hypothetical protein